MKSIISRHIHIYVCVAIMAVIFILPSKAHAVACGAGTDNGNGVCVVFIKVGSSSPWAVPADWNNASNTIEVIGGGGHSSGAFGGGGGGAYAIATNVTLGSTAQFSVGTGGIAGSNGGNTWFNGASVSAASAGALGGQTATTDTGGVGGANTGGSGTQTAGGNGGNGNTTLATYGGGGGAAGPAGIGRAGGNGDATGAGADAHGGGGGSGGGSSTVGSNGTTDGGNGGQGPTGAGFGAGGAGGNGTSGTLGGGGGGADDGAFNGGDGGTAQQWNASHGSGGGGGGAEATAGSGGLYGGGGGGGSSSGANGIIVIRYTPLTILSGTLYSDEGVTPITTTKTIRIAIGTSTISHHSTTTRADGTWSFALSSSNTIVASTPILIWVDGDSTTFANTFTKASGPGAISGLDLYKRRVILKQEAWTATSTTNTNLAFYDGDDDPDIQYTSNGGAFSLRKEMELHLWPGTSYVPGGTVTLHGNASTSPDGDIHLPYGLRQDDVATGTILSMDSNILTLAGSWYASSSARYNSSNYTRFNSTSTQQKYIIATSTDIAFYEFNGSGGSWTFGSHSATTSGSFDVISGTVTAPSSNLVVGDFFRLQGSSVFNHNNGTIIFNSSDAQNIAPVSGIPMTGTNAFNNLIFRGLGSKTFGATIPASTTNFTIESGSGTIVAPSYLSISGNFTNSGTFSHNGGTVITSTSSPALGQYTGASFDTNSTGNSNTYGIEAHNDFLWVVDQTDDEVYKYTTSGTYTGTSFDTAASGNTDPKGIVFYNNFFWIVDNTGAEVYKYNSDGSYANTSFDTAASGATNPVGITYYKGYFWITDLIDDEVYKYNTDGSYTGISFDTAVSGGTYPTGIIGYSNFLWITDFDGARIYKYTENGTYTGTSFSTTASGAANPVGITNYNGYFWLTDQDDAEVYKYSASQIFSGTMTGSSAFNNLTFQNQTGKVFTGNASTSGTFTVTSTSTEIQFQAGSTTTFVNMSLNGQATTSRIVLKSSSTTAQWNLVSTGTQAVSYVDVTDSNACGGDTISAANSVLTNTSCWVSPAPLILSGTLYSDEGVTPVTSGKTIMVAVGTTSPPSLHTTTSNGSGAWSFTLDALHSVTPGIPILSWVDGDASTPANVFTKASSSINNISGLDLYKRRVIIKHEGFTGTSTTNADLAFYDGDNDPDIQYTSNGGDYSQRKEMELHIAPGTTYEPGGTVTLHGSASTSPDGDLHLAGGVRQDGVATSTIFSGSNLTLAGSLYASSTGTVWANTITFNSTSTQQKNITATSTSSLISGFMFNGSGGSWTFGPNAATTSNGGVTILAGTVTAPSTYLTLDCDYSNLGSFIHNSGTVVMNNDTACQLGGNMTGANAFNNVIFRNAGGKTFNAAASTTNFTIESTSGAVTAPSSYLSVSGDYTNNGTFTHNGGTTTFNGTANTQTLSGTMTGASPFNHITFTGNRTKQFSGSASTTNWHVDGSSGGITLALNGKYTISGNYVYNDLGVLSVDTGSEFIFSSSAPQYISGISLNEGGGDLPSLRFIGSGTKTFLSNASTTDSYSFTIESGATVVAPPYLSIRGTYTNNGTFTHNGGKVLFGCPGCGTQQLSGNMTGTSAFNNVEFTPEGNTFNSFSSNSASTSDFVIGAGHAVTFPSNALSITGNYTNSGTTTHNGGTVYFSSTTNQTASGTMTGTSAFNNVRFIGGGTKKINGNASTTNFTVDANVNVSHPTALTISGNYTNNGTSTNGTASVWTSRPATTTNSWNAVTYGNGLFVAVANTGTGNRVMTSPDGITWTPRTSAQDSGWTGITYGEGLFVAVAESGTNRVMTSPDGIVWTVRNASQNIGWRDVAYGNGNFVAVAYNGTSTSGVMTSPDGITWTTRAPALSAVWDAIVYGGGQFVAVAQSFSNSEIMTSPDGITWTLRTTPTSQNWNDIAYGDGMYVAVGDSGSHLIMSSPNAIDWTLRTSPVSNLWGSIAHGNGMFVVVSYSGNSQNKVITSPDGINWTARVAPNDFAPISNGVVYGNGRFVAVTTFGTGNILTSEPGMLHFSSSSAQTLTGGMTGKDTFASVEFTGAGTKTFSNNASTSGFTIGAGTVSAPSSLSIAGNYSNAGTFTNNAGIVYATAPSIDNTYTGVSFDTAASGNALPGGIVFADGFFWVTDNFNDEVYKYNSNGTYASISFDTAASGNGDPYGITFADGFFWITDNADDEVYKYKPDGVYAGTSFDTAGSGATSPYGITFANGSLWIADDTNDEVYRYNLDGSYANFSFDTAASGNDGPTGITFYNNYFWIIDNGDDEVYKYSVSGNPISSFDTNVSGGTNPWSITSHNGSLWVTDLTADEVYKYNGAQSFSGTMTSSSAFNNFSSIGRAGTVIVNTASTTNFTIATTSGTVSAPTTTLTIAGNFSNGTTTGFAHNFGTLVMASSSVSNGYTGTSLSVSAGTPRSATYYDGFFWVVDGGVADEVEKYNSNGVFTSLTFSTAGSGNTDPDAITTYDNHFWITDTADAEVYKYTANGTYTGISFDTAASGNSLPEGITFYDGFFWIVDPIDAEVYKYTSGGTYTGISFDTAGSGNGSPIGIAYYGGYFWIVDNSDAEVYKYTSGGTYTGISFDTAGSGNGNPLGITSGNGALWVLDNVDSALYKYTVGQGLSGTLTGDSALNNVTFSGGAGKDFANNASTSNVTIATSSGSVVAPVLLTLSGNYHNATTSGFVHNSGTTTLTGNATQTLSGTMTGASAFHNLNVTNTSGTGSTTQSVVFAASASTTDTLRMTASTSARFLASATSTFQNIHLEGVANRLVWLRSSSPGSQYNFYVPGIQRRVSYVNVRDNNACPTTIIAVNTIEVSNNTCWSIASDLILSGTLYSDEGITAITTGKTIGIAVGTSTVSRHTTTTNGSGVWSFNLGQEHSITSGTPILAWVDNDVSTPASVFTKASSTINSISQLNLFRRRAILKHEGFTGTSVTNADLAFYDRDNDTDIPYTSNSGTFTMQPAMELHLAPGTTYEPGGTVWFNGSGTTTNPDGDLHISGGLRQDGVATSTHLSLGSNNFVITGNWFASSSARLTHTGTVYFRSTSTLQKQILATSTPFFEMDFNGWPNGNWIFTGPATATDDIWINNTTDSVTAPATTLSVGGDWGFFDGDVPTFIHNGGTVIFFKSSTTPQEIIADMVDQEPFNNLIFRGSAPKIFADWYASTSNITIESSSGAVRFPSVNLTLTGNYINNSTFDNSGGGTVTFSSSSPQTLSGNMTGNSAFNHLRLTGSGSKTFSNNASTTDLTIESGSGNVVAPAYLSVQGNYSNSGSFTHNSGTTTFSGPSFAGSTQLGNALAISNVNTHTITALSSTDIAFFDNNNDSLRLYRFDGTNWSLVGSGLTISTTGAAALAALDSTDIAFIDSDNDSLRVYRFNGSTWSQVGNSLSITGAGTPTLASLTSTDVAYFDHAIDELRTYRFNGSDWSLIGSGFSLSAVTPPVITSLNSSDIAVVYSAPSDYSELRTYRFNGSTWSQVGTGLRIVDHADAISTINSTDILLVQPYGFRVYRFAGSAWSLVGSDNSSLCCSAVLARLSSTSIAYLNTSDDLLKALHISETQSLTGVMTGGSAFNNLVVTNISATTTFASAASTTGNFYALEQGTQLEFAPIQGSGMTSANFVGRATSTTSTGSLALTTGVTIESGNLAVVVIAKDESSTSGSDAETTEVDSLSDTSGNTWRLAGEYMNSETTSAGDGAVVSVWYSVLSSTLSSGNTITANFESSITSKAMTAWEFVLPSGSTVARAAAPQTLSNDAADAGSMSISGLSNAQYLFIRGVAAEARGTGSITPTASFTEINLANADTGSNATSMTVVGEFWITTGTGATSDPTTGGQDQSSVFAALEIIVPTVQFQNARINGSASEPVWLRSTEASTQFGIKIPGSKSLSYVDVKDSYACPTTLTASNSVDSGNNNCWAFGNPSVSISSGENQIFSYGQATTSISTLTIADAATPAITAANDLRIVIATTSTNMRWDITGTTAVFGGTASGKVSNPISYLGGGEILVVPVNSNFASNDTLTISGLSYSQFASATPPVNAIGLRISGVGTTTDATDDKTIAITGALALSNHSAGQVSDSFDFTNQTETELIAFRLAPQAETSTVSSLVVGLSGVYGLLPGDLTNVALYRDLNSNKTYDAGETAVGGSGTVSINGQTGSITFGSSFNSTTTQDYLVVGDISSIVGRDSTYLSLSASGVTASGLTSGLSVTSVGSVTSVFHRKGSAGGGGLGSEIGGAAPPGQGTQTGGGAGGGGEIDPNSGNTIGNEPGFKAPTQSGTPINNWTNGSNALTSDGSYATAASSLSQSYGNFGFNVPGNNTITGIGVKLEASATTNAGTISVRLSWDGGGSVTSLLTTGTVSTTDAVYELGGPSNTWGRAWTPAETANGSFTIEVVANPSGNTIRLDAVQVNIYHQATGGGQGGGGAVYKGQTQFFANAYTAAGHLYGRFLEWLFGWTLK